jgi:hypothetical protein
MIFFILFYDLCENPRSNQYYTRQSINNPQSSQYNHQQAHRNHQVIIKQTNNNGD